MHEASSLNFWRTNGHTHTHIAGGYTHTHTHAVGGYNDCSKLNNVWSGLYARVNSQGAKQRHTTDYLQSWTGGNVNSTQMDLVIAN